MKTAYLLTAHATGRRFLSMNEAQGVRRRSMYSLGFIDPADTAWHLSRSKRILASPDDTPFGAYQRDRDRRTFEVQHNQKITEEALCDTPTTDEEKFPDFIEHLATVLGLPSH